MKKFWIALCLLAVTALFAAAPDSSWFTNFSKAQTAAREKGKPMYVLFTGSSWCPWCIKLHNEVLAKDSFKKFLGKNFVAVFLDFPAMGNPPAANAALMEKYGVEGFPTVVVLDPSGKVLGRLGYSSLEEQIAELQKLVK